MIKCGDDCNPLCDFCQHFEPKLVLEYLPKRIYVDGTGRCILYDKETDVCWGVACEGFHCFLAEGEENDA